VIVVQPSAPLIPLRFPPLLAEQIAPSPTLFCGSQLQGTGVLFSPRAFFDLMLCLVLG